MDNELIYADDPIGVATDRGLVLPNLLRNNAATIGDVEFLVDPDGRRETYAQTWESARLWAQRLKSFGLAEGSHIGLLLEPCFEAHHIWVGASLVGLIDAPLNPAYRGHLLQYTLNNCKAPVLVTRGSFLELIREIHEDLQTLHHIIILDEGDWPSQIGSIKIHQAAHLTDEPLDESAARQPEPADICSLLYTSGTTGPSKGVRVRWGQITVGSELGPVDYMAQLLDGAPSTAFCPYPVYHLTGKVPLISAARTGGRVLVVERYSTSTLWEHIREFQCTSMGMVGAISQFVMSTSFESEDVESLQHVSMSPVAPEVDHVAKLLGVSVSTAYGSTEAGWPLLNRVATGSNYLSCGLIREGYQLRIVDEQGNDVPTGEVGELLVRSSVPELMSAQYFDMPEKTAEAWAGGWFHTGDAFRCDSEGRYYFLDRIKDAIRRRGENISSFEVETYVDQHESVLRSAAIAVPSEHSEDEVKVYVIPEPGHTIDIARLHSWLSERMPRFMIPRFIEVIDDFPLTDTGKVKKTLLREWSESSLGWDSQQRGPR